MKEFKDDKNRWRDIPCFLMGRINIVKITMLHKGIYTCNTTHFKLPMETPMIPNDQSNIEIKYPEINPCTYSQLIYNKGGKTIQWKKDSLFNK